MNRLNVESRRWCHKYLRSVACLRRSGLVLLLTVILLLLLSSVALAKTPAGTKIVNQGVILYEDEAGNSYTTTSNQVIIEVLPVYGISILPDGTAAAPGQSQDAVAEQRVYFPYTLTNTGNTDDSYLLAPTLDSTSTFLPQLPDGNTGIEIFWDENMNGVIDTGEPLVASWRDLNGNGAIDSGEMTSDNLGPLNQDEVTGLIIAYNVPAAASAGDVCYVGVDGTSTHDSGAQDLGNVHKTAVIDDAVIAVTKSASPTVVDPGDTVTYTLSGENRGTQFARGRSYTVDGSTYTGVLVYDIIPTHSGNSFTVTGTLSGAPSGGTVIYANPADPNTDPTTWSWSTSYTAGDKVIGYVTSDGATNQDLAVSATISLTFQVQVPSDYPAGYIDNYGYVSYADNQPTPGDHTVKSNDATVEVQASAGVDIRDTDYISPGVTPNPADDGSGTSNDTETYTSAAAGSTVEFTNRVTNTGTATDVFDISLDGSFTLPAGWTVTFYSSDGLTPLPDTDSDGVPDVGSLGAGEYRDIVVKVTIPADQGAATGPWDAVIEARSSLNTTVSDTTTDRIDAITQAGVDIQNRDGAADPSPTIAAGECADYPLDVINTGQAPDVFTLSWSGLSSGWNVVFYRDTDDDGTLDPGEKTPVTYTVLLDPGGADHFIAVVCSANDATPGTSTINFTATSTNNRGVTDTQSDTINVASACALSLVPDHSGIVRPGGVAWYEHVLKNTGDQTATINLTLTATTGWTHLLYYGEAYDDGAGHAYSAGDPAVDTDSDGTPDVPNLVPGEQVKVEVKVFAPSDAAEGTTDIATLTAVSSCGANAEAVDVTQVVSGGLVLHKTQQVTDYNANGILGDPGDRITYTTSYKNISAGPLNDVTVYETIPAHTHLSLIHI